jgi:hypothetical protein
MDILEVYALNIQPNQIMQLIPTRERTVERIELERSHFLYWLREQGNKFSDQVSAWVDYISIVDFDFSDGELDEEPIWLQELKFKLEEEVLRNQRNYDEFRGQQ